jgi:hypothetical protein
VGLDEVDDVLGRLGDRQVEDVVAGIVRALPVDAGAAVGEGQVRQAFLLQFDRCGRLLLGSLGLGFEFRPVIGNQFLGQIDRLRFKIQDVLRVGVGVVVAPGVSAVEVEVDEAAVVLDFVTGYLIRFFKDLMPVLVDQVEFAGG